MCGNESEAKLQYSENQQRFQSLGYNFSEGDCHDPSVVMDMVPFRANEVGWFRILIYRQIRRDNGSYSFYGRHTRLYGVDAIVY